MDECKICAGRGEILAIIDDDQSDVPCPACCSRVASEKSRCIAELEASLTAAYQERDGAWNENEYLRHRLRMTGRILIEAVGADGPMNAEDAAKRAVKRIAELEQERVILIEFLDRQREFSLVTFGPGDATDRASGICDHIRKELDEILQDPMDLEEWIDVAILAFDGALRTGATSGHIVQALIAKQEKNETRAWPNWLTAEPGKAIEHVRGEVE